MTWTKIRAFIMGLVAVVLIILMAAIGAEVAGLDIPVLSDITEFLGIQNDK